MPLLMNSAHADRGLATWKNKLCLEVGYFHPVSSSQFLVYKQFWLVECLGGYGQC